MTSDQSDGRDQRIQQLLDRAEVAQIQIRGGQLVDRGEWDTLKELYAPGATYSSSYNKAAGERPIADVIEHSRKLASQYTLNMRFIGNQTVTVEGDRATVQAYVISYHWKGDPPGADHPENLITGDLYLDSFERDNGRWLVAHRNLDRLWYTGPLPR
jgi:hypothetical protein